MATKTSTQLFNEVRDTMAGVILSALTNADYELIQVTDAKWSIPYVDAEGNEGWAQVAISRRKGSRDDGLLYDGYTEGEQYREKKEKQARKAEERARKAAERKAEQERKKAEKAAAKAAKEKKDEEGKGE